MDVVYAARDYVEGMWLILQQEQPEDFVLATGETHPVREFVEKSFSLLGTTIQCVSACVRSDKALTRYQVARHGC